MQISSNSSSVRPLVQTRRLAGPPPAEALPTKIKQVSDIPAEPQSQQELESEPARTRIDGPIDLSSRCRAAVASGCPYY
jgi:hypothetical protein